MTETPPSPQPTGTAVDPEAPAAQSRARQLWHFLRHVAARFLEDRCPQLAAGLSYASLLALVPLMAIGLASLTAFPAFDNAQEQLKNLIFEALPPEQALAAAEQMDALLANVANLTGPGVLALAVTAILLLSNVNASLNAIWHVRERRPLALQLLVYWALLTLGPLLLGASISVSGVAFGLSESYLGFLGEGMQLVSRLLAVILAMLAFSVLFLVVPNRPVGIAAAALGGGVAAVGFELLKFGFGLYITNFPSYQVVYGAMAALPILLIWIYLVWIVVLTGAEVAATWPEWQAAQLRGFEGCGPLDRLPLALAVLQRLKAAQIDGGPLRRRDLVRDLPMPPAEVDLVLSNLRRDGYIATTPGGRWLLARTLEGHRLRDLLDSLDLILEPSRHWPPPVPAILSRVREGVTGPLDVGLDSLVQAGQVAPEPTEADGPLRSHEADA
ncbi:YihY family inner membrane protein [Aquibaculum sediminis]|uniref:YihY family inner membrane protein n=1 Tax=Aquibaculum sediminis TaxID=3231907 RepID=UPI0034526648